MTGSDPFAVEALRQTQRRFLSSVPHHLMFEVLDQSPGFELEEPIWPGPGLESALRELVEVRLKRDHLDLAERLEVDSRWRELHSLLSAAIEASGDDVPEVVIEMRDESAARLAPATQIDIAELGWLRGIAAMLITADHLADDGYVDSRVRSWRLTHDDDHGD